MGQSEGSRVNCSRTGPLFPGGRGPRGRGVPVAIANDLAGKTVLVTGASSGIGAATALAFAERGSHLLLTGRNREALAEVSAKAQAFGVKAQVEAFDIKDEKKLAQFLATLDCDIAVNNAGIEGKIADTTALTLSDYDEVMDINLRSLWQCLQGEVAHFRARKKKGVIVNVSSVAGLSGIPTSSLYVASKHAVVGLTKAVSLEQIPHGIRINAVCPGLIETPMLGRVYPNGYDQVAAQHPVGRPGTPSEVAEMIVWLASEASRFVVGQAFAVDGGRTAQLA